MQSGLSGVLIPGAATIRRNGRNPSGKRPFSRLEKRSLSCRSLCNLFCYAQRGLCPSPEWASLSRYRKTHTLYAAYPIFAYTASPASHPACFPIHLLRLFRSPEQHALLILWLDLYLIGLGDQVPADGEGDTECVGSCPGRCSQKIKGILRACRFGRDAAVFEVFDGQPRWQLSRC